MSVGRNELCPCGSGKKYKRCCGNVTPISQIRSYREEKLRKEYEVWLERMNQFASSVPGVDQARKRFAAESGLSVPESKHPQWAIHFFNWFVFDDRTDGTTVFERFVQQDGRRMDRDLQQAFHHMAIGLYEFIQADGDTLTLRDLADGQTVYAVNPNNLVVEQGNILIGRLLHFGVRRLLHSGSMMLPARFKPAFREWLLANGISQHVDHTEIMRQNTTGLYRFIQQLGKGNQETDRLVQRKYQQADHLALLQRLRNNRSFELKKRDQQQQIWVYTTGTEEYLFPELDNALMTLNEVLGEVTLTKDEVILEAFEMAVEGLAETLLLPAAEDYSIERLSSTGLPLTRGTIFISSQPDLPDKLLNWAVQTYFAENWLVTPQQELGNTAPLLMAAADNPKQREQVLQVVEKIEETAQHGAGPGRFMQMDLIRPRLGLPNQAVDIHNLLVRPVIGGGFNSNYTVLPERLAEISNFVAEMTEGKSEATMKKYDEVMGLFRSFIREGFGPGFVWSRLRAEEVAYFLVHNLLKRVDSPTKTMATQLLSVLTSFFKWLDKHTSTELTDRIQPLLTAMKDDLPEAYRIRAVLAKEASIQLHRSGNDPLQVVKEHLLLVDRTNRGWNAKRPNGEIITLLIDKAASESLAPDWIIAGVIGETAKGEWQLYGSPELYPPVVGELMGVNSSVLV